MNYTNDTEKVTQFNQMYFDDAIELLDKIKGLKSLASLTEDQYAKIAIPSLYALIERLAYSRYFHHGITSSGRRFKKLLSNYTSTQEKILLDKVDIVFLYQWDVSSSSNEDKYIKKIGSTYQSIKNALKNIYKIEFTVEIPEKKGLSIKVLYTKSF